MKIRKTCAPGGKRVDIGGSNNRMPIAPQPIRPMLIGDEKDVVWFFAHVVNMICILNTSHLWHQDVIPWRGELSNRHFDHRWRFGFNRGSEFGLKFVWRFRPPP